MDRRKSSFDKSKYNKNTHEWEEEDIDEEMEEIFHPANDHFSLADLVGRDEEAKPHFDEKDFDLHRRESLQYHQPLHRLYHHKHKKSSHKHEKPGDEKSQMSTVSEEPVVDPSREKEPHKDEPLLSRVPITRESSSVQQKDDSKDKVQFYVGSSTSLENAALQSNKKPLKSVLRAFTNRDGTSSNELSPSFHSPSSLKKQSEDVILTVDVDSSLEKPINGSTSGASFDKEKAKVTFLLGEESQTDLQKDFQKDAVEQSKSQSHPKHSRRQSTKRKHHGFNVGVKNYNTVLEPEEAETLQSADIDDMASHRFEDPKGIHRSKIRNKFWPSFLNKEDLPIINFYKKKYDRTPHKLFIELHELQQGTYDLYWRQTARWIKYEEDVELGPDRWGKPHVSTLCFLSLTKLRQCIVSAAILLDLEENDLVGISNRIVDAMIQTDQLDPNLKDTVLRTLMQRHKHVNEKEPLMRRNSSGYGNLNLLGHDKSRSPLFLKSTRSKSLSDAANHALNNGESATPAERAILMDSHEMNAVEITPTSKRKSISGEKEKTPDPSILRRVPTTAEGAALLVGELDELERPVSAFVRLAEGKQIPYVLEVPIKLRFICVLLGPTGSSMNFHEIGRALGTLMNNDEFRVNVYQATCVQEFLSSMNKFLVQSIVLPPGSYQRTSLLPIEEIRRKSLSVAKPPKELPKKPSYDPLKRTKKPFGGLIKDIKNRYPFYLSDILDGFNFQCVASVIFIYFAAISGAIAFGGLLADKTALNIGVSETLIGTSVCGILFALFSGQPLIIIGTTGPLLLFDEMLFQLQEYYSCPFLVMRVWVGIWTALIAIVVVAAEGSVLVKFFSRFVQEIFATIISLLFIFESLSKLYKIFEENPLLADYCNVTDTNNTNVTYLKDTDVTYLKDIAVTFLNDTDVTFLNATGDSSEVPHHPQPNTALLSAILMIGTFYIALFLRHFRNSKFLGRSARRALGDFGVPIGIVIMVLIDYFIKDTYTQKLSVPEGLSPSTERSWFISPLPITAMDFFLALVGGLLIFILLFMETQICELIISKKQLQKGSGFHIDMVLIGIMETISAFIGGPWQCAATVRSISHVSSLIVWSKTHAPGDLPHIVEVKEQRLTNLLVSLLVGLSVLMAPVLRQVPLAVLFGVFLYMGISALSGIHLYERFLLIFMPVKHYPDFPFVRKVRTHRMHIYTGIQILLIALLWLLKTYFAPAFPFGLLTLVFIHSHLNCFFRDDELKHLDEEASDDEDIMDNEDEPDFYEQIVA